MNLKKPNKRKSGGEEGVKESVLGKVSLILIMLSENKVTKWLARPL